MKRFWCWELYTSYVEETQKKDQCDEVGQTKGNTMFISISYYMHIVAILEKHVGLLWVMACIVVFA